MNPLIQRRLRKGAGPEVRGSGVDQVSAGAKPKYTILSEEYKNQLNKKCKDKDAVVR